MAYYDLHFMDNIPRDYFAALPTCIFTVVYRVHGTGSNFAGHELLGSSQPAIAILPLLRLFIYKQFMAVFNKLYRVFII